MRDFLLRGGIPVTKTVMICAVLTLFASAMSPPPLPPYLLPFMFRWPGVVFQPWSAITYPLMSCAGCALSVLFAVIWLWFVGGSLERSWGSKAFALFFAWVSLLTAIGASAAALLARNEGVALAGLWVPLAPLTVAWAAANPESQVLFYFIVPLKAKYLAWICVGLLYLSEGVHIHPLYGLLVLLGCVVAYYQVSHPQRMYRAPERDIRIYRASRRLPSPFERFREWKRRKRLEKLFRNSGYGDPR